MVGLSKLGWHLEKGQGRTRLELAAFPLGEGLVVCLYNEAAHLGAVAVGEWDQAEERASTSVITRLGHKDDAVAIEAAHDIARATRRPVCVIAGIHVDNIAPQEIGEIVQNCREVVGALVKEVAP